MDRSAMAVCAACGRAYSGTQSLCPSCGAPPENDDFATRTVAVATAATPRRSSRSVHDGRFAPGAVLAGRYRIIALLGKGGMGEVYRADDLQLDQQVALKFLPERLSRNEEAIARFRNEVRTARQVSHPNVCRVYDLTEIAGTYVLSMEYVDGEDLGSLLRRIGRLPGDKAIEIARKLCAGLAAAHDKGVLHRDLKPANIMLDRNGQVLLTDFGLAGLAGEIDGSEVRNGTPAYMAPEQLAGLEVTVKSDIYALGLVLYELFTGKLPFDSDTLAGLIQARAESAPVNPTTLVRDLDPAVEKIILRCLQAKPSLRPPSALAVSAALPGGDRLAAALAAGETPSPEMVAEAGEGQGLSPRTAILLLAAILIFTGAGEWLSLPRSALEHLRPPYSPEVLQQKARDLIQSLGYNGSPADSVGQFSWDDEYTRWLRKEKPKPDWNRFLSGRPAPLVFWYRQADSDLFGEAFHDDWLTPGIVQAGDPPPTESGMIYVQMDDQGRLLRFESVPKQRLEELKQPAPAPDWMPLFGAARLDPQQLKPAEPIWTWLASSDTRAAWTGTWPGTDRPLRVEAAALRGKPVAFMLIGPWTSTWREPGGNSTPVQMVLLTLIVAAILIFGPWLAHRNFVKGRGDRRGARNLAIFFSCSLLTVWITRAHFAGPLPAVGLFLIELATAVFYGAVMWMVYLAAEPYIRRRWPQTLISWTSLLGGKVADPVVGRDVLIGAAVGMSFALVDIVINFQDWRERLPIFGSTSPLNGFRPTLSTIVAQIPTGIRGAVMFVFLIFLLRVLLRSQWAAGIAFALLFASISYFESGRNWTELLAAFLIYGIIALAMLRWGLLAGAVGILVGNVQGYAALTAHGSDWFFLNTLIPIIVVVALTIWGAWTSCGARRLFKGELFD